jgi:6-pyruvoyltetrahydropterin/6-carboxytetrahydropterin synthase
MMNKIFYTSSINFEAARAVSILPEGHRSRRLHGHSFLAKVRTIIPNNFATFSGGEVSDLKKILANAVRPLDYQSLNEKLSQPTDENIARWLRNELQALTIENIGIQSTGHQGVDLDRNDQVHVWKRYIFESAHQLPNVPNGHKCGRMHGHRFEVILHANQDLGNGNISIDYDHLDTLWAPIFNQLNYCCLNDVPELENPTSEMISSWIWKRLKPQLPELSWVTVFETASCGAHFDGENYHIWKEFSLDSAVRLIYAPEGDTRRRIHGHTYTLRLHLSAPLDQVMGWTVDFGDVKTMFEPVFTRLDHHPLNDLPGIQDGDCASLAYWIKEQIDTCLPQIERIDLYENPGCGVILSWGELDPALPV